jgi:cephalosporin hydroxylase
MMGKKAMPSDLKELDEVIEHAAKKTDISDHLVTLFVETLAAKPKFIVELGVRSGESTFVLERAAKICDSRLLSLDVADCSNVSSFKNWTFIQKDDIEFGSGFADWCKLNGYPPRIDVLFIDTSHLYEHTVQEIRAYFPLLSPKAKVLFHDTNLRYFNKRRDGSLCWGSWNNKRGVIKAIEEYFNTSYNERKDFIDIKDGWLIKHYSYCNGLTVLEKNYHPIKRTDVEHCQ